MTETSRRTERPAWVQEPHAATESSGCSSPRGAPVRENSSALVLVFIHFSKLLHLPLHGVGGGGFHFLRVGGVGSQGGNFAQKGSSCYILGQPLPMAKEASGTWHGLRKLQQSHDRKGSRRCLPVGGTLRCWLQRRWCHSPGDLCCPNSGSHWS